MTLYNIQQQTYVFAYVNILIIKIPFTIRRDIIIKMGPSLYMTLFCFLQLAGLIITYFLVVVQFATTSCSASGNVASGCNCTL